MNALLNPSLFERYVRCGNSIVLAVSGGGDSMAVLDLYRLARIQNPNLPAPYVVTVDHGLRQGFAKEAAIVDTYCAKFELPWQLARWEGDKPKTGIMAAARLARYRLLADAAGQTRAGVILTGHTLDDQNETLAMRATRGKALPMESDVLFERRALISRPFLSVSRDELRAHLEENTIVFADDPTNVDMRFERSRVRAENVEVTFAPAASAPRADLMERAAAFIMQHVNRTGDSVIVKRPQARDREVESLALRYLAAALGQFEYSPPQTIGDRLQTLLGEGQRSAAFTAQRCCFKRIDGGISISQDLRHQGHPWLQQSIAPFETFCGYSLLALANALAETLGAPRFILPTAAAI
jgi:tRNA(Ile)-lysidine synthase